MMNRRTRNGLPDARPGAHKLLRVAAAGGILLAASGPGAGCALFRRDPPVAGPPDSPRVRAFFEQAQDPRRFAMHVYDSRDGAIFIGAQRLHPNQGAELAFRSPRNDQTPVIEVRTRTSGLFPALIDTSSLDSWVPFDLAVEVEAVPLGLPAYERLPDHVPGEEPGYACVLPGLRMDELHVENPVFFVRMQTGDLGPLARDTVRPIPRLVIGCELLRAFRVVQFDFPERRVAFSTTHPYDPPEKNLLAAAPLVPARRLLVEGRVDGQAIRLVLDTAGAFDLALPDHPTQTVDQLTVGGLVMRQVPVTQLPPGSRPRIGRGILGRFKITIDNRRNLVYFERPSS